jgi:hypothetical protein
LGRGRGFGAPLDASLGAPTASPGGAVFGPRPAAGPSDDFGIPVMSPPPAQVALPPPPRDPDPPIEQIVIDAPGPMPTVAAPLVAASTEGAPVLKFSGSSRSTPAPQQGEQVQDREERKVLSPRMGVRPLAAPANGPSSRPQSDGRSGGIQDTEQARVLRATEQAAHGSRPFGVHHCRWPVPAGAGRRAGAAGGSRSLR